MTIMTIELKNKKAKRLLKELESLDLIHIVSSKMIDIAPDKKAHAGHILKSYQQAQLHAAGKVQLKTAQQLLDEL